MKTGMVECYDEEQKWITNRWIGASLKRLGLTEKRRTGKGTEYRLTNVVVKDLAERMEIELEPKNESERLETLIRCIKDEQRKNDSPLIERSFIEEKIKELAFKDSAEKVFEHLFKDGVISQTDVVDDYGVGN